MNFSAWSIRNPVAPLLLFFMLMYVGVKSFYSLPITRFPNIDVPIVSVVVTQRGASPAELEMQVTKEIEDAVAAISGVDEIQSTVTDGQSVTSVVFRIEKPTAEAVQDTKDAIDRTKAVAQLEGEFSSVRATALIPIDSLNPIQRFRRVKGVGVTAIINVRL